MELRSKAKRRGVQRLPSERQPTVEAVPKHPKASVDFTEHSNKKSNDHERSSSLSACKKVCTACTKFGKYILLLLLLPPFLNYVSVNKEMDILKPEIGEFYDIGQGQELFFGCRGSGQPTVVLDAPIGGTSDSWRHLLKSLSQSTRVCFYDRAGLGFSERPSMPVTPPNQDGDTPSGLGLAQPFTLERAADDLHKLLTQSSQQPTPFLLVGADYSALLAQFYTRMYGGDNVAGMVLVDPLPPQLFVQRAWIDYWFADLVVRHQMLQAQAAAGVTRLGVLLGAISFSDPSIGPEAKVHDTTEQLRQVLHCHPRHLKTAADEMSFLNDSLSQLATVAKLRSYSPQLLVTVLHRHRFDPYATPAANLQWQEAMNTFSDTFTHKHTSQKLNVVERRDIMFHKNNSRIIEKAILSQINLWRKTSKTSSN